MNNHGHSTQVWVLLATLVGLLLVAGCADFWVNPALTAITVTPITPSITVGSTVQMIATGTYSDGSTSTVGASWASSGTIQWRSSTAALALLKELGWGLQPSLLLPAR